MDDLTALQHEPADILLDITSEVCPMTYVRTRLALDRMLPGQVLEVRLCGAEPAVNVPRSARQQGHTVLGMAEMPDGISVLRLRRR